MKTSRIKAIQDIAGDGIKWNGTYYHNLEMENGDKINIGKQKYQHIGWELTYEITGDGQHEYNKAQAVQKEEDELNPQSSSNAPQKIDKVQTYIIRQSSLNRAIEHLTALGADQNLTKENATKLADYYTNWVMS